MRERLLERIRRSEEKKTSDLPESRQILDSVQRHLSLLLNTQRGSVLIADDYGIPDFFSLFGLGDVEALSRLEAMLEKVVEKYEPRLRDVSIKVTNRDSAGLNLHLVLAAKLPMEGSDMNVSFDTVLDSGGRVSID